MTERASTAAIEEGLASSNPEDVYDAVIDIGKQGHRELVPRVVPFLASSTPFLREAALRTLVFHLHLPAHKDDAIRMLALDPDEGVRQAAALGLCGFARTDRQLLERLLAVALDPREEEIVRDAAFISALVAAGIPGDTLFPRARRIPGFDANADWALLARALRGAGVPVPPGVAERAARQSRSEAN